MFRSLTICFLSYLFLMSCQKEPGERINSTLGTSADSLIILGFFPDSARVGDSVMVWGKRFDTSANGNLVAVNNIQQRVLHANDSFLLFQIMPGTSTGKVSVSARSQQAFSFKSLVIDSLHSALMILSFSPDSAYVGNTILIKGKGFSSISADNIVAINAVQQQIIASTDSTLLIKIASGTTTGKISITVQGQTITSLTNLRIVVYTPAPLLIISFSPDFAKIGDTILIKGTGFGSSISSVSVKINGTQAQLINVKPDTILIKLSDGTTTGKISITVNGQTVTSLNDLFIVQSGGAWTQKKDFAAQWSDFSSAVGISAGNRGFYFKQELWEYLPQQNSWIKKADKPADGSGVCNFWFIINNQIFVGYGGYTSLDSVRLWAYSLSTDTWTKKKNLPIQPRISPFGFAVNNVGYVGGGQISFTGNIHGHDFWKYDEQNDSWSRMADFPGPWTIGISGFAIGSEPFVYDAGTGYPQAPLAGVTHGRLWHYNVASNSWEEKASCPGGASNFSAAAFSIGNKGYVAVSVIKSPTDPKNDFWTYDPALNTWSKKEDVGGGLRWFGSGFSIGSHGYMGLGTGNTYAQQKKDFWEYTPQ